MPNTSVGGSTRVLVRGQLARFALIAQSHADVARGLSVAVEELHSGLPDVVVLKNPH